MNVTEAEVLISSVTFAVSVGTSLFVAGRKFGKLEAMIDSKASREEVTEVKHQLSVMSVTLGEIKGMFRLTLRDEER